MISAAMAEEALHRLGVFGVQREDHHREFLGDAMEWAALDHVYLPMKIASEGPKRVSLDELNFLTAALDALGELAGGERATGKAVWDDGTLEVELELLPAYEPPVAPEGGASA